MIFSKNGLQEFGFVNMEYPDSLRGIVENAVQSWKKFCELPSEDKCTFSFLEDNHGDGSGYELKEKGGLKQDRKESFQITLFQYPRLSEIANNRTFPFLNDAKRLLDSMEPLIFQFSKMIEETYEIEGFLDEVRHSKPYWILRYLHYFGDQPEGHEIAAPHIDKGGFTLHLFESDEGLQYYSVKERLWRGMPIGKKETVIIPAAQLQLWSKGDLKALYHRVVATKDTAQMGRFSMVCFIPFQQVPMYNKKVHGSMQVHDVGFNYDLPHNAFADYFS